MKILFASLPADGHFEPLTPVATHLAQKGHDVRWYAGPGFDLRSERPKPARIAAAVRHVLNNPDIRAAVSALSKELNGYAPTEIIESAILKEVTTSQP